MQTNYVKVWRKGFLMRFKVLGGGVWVNIDPNSFMKYVYITNLYVIDVLHVLWLYHIFCRFLSSVIFFTTSTADVYTSRIVTNLGIVCCIPVYDLYTLQMKLTYIISLVSAVLSISNYLQKPSLHVTVFTK